MPATIDLTSDELLTTTRAVRKRLDFDRPVDLELVKECLQLGLQAPSGSNAQGWNFMVVTDADKKKAIGELYKDVFFNTYAPTPGSVHSRAKEAPESEQKIAIAVRESADHLANNMARVPVMVIPCVMGRLNLVPQENATLAWTGSLGSIFPAMWSFMLAARTRGLGTCWTSLHLFKEQEVADILGIPYDEVTQTALISVGHTIGDKFKATTRRPLGNALHVDSW